MLRKIKFFQNKIKITKISKNNKIGDVIIGEYLSIDKDGIHQYKFGGVCISILKKTNINHILLRQKVSNIKVDFCINLTSPLIYFFKTIGKSTLPKQTVSYKVF